MSISLSSCNRKTERNLNNYGNDYEFSHTIYFFALSFVNINIIYVFEKDNNRLKTDTVNLEARGLHVHGRLAGDPK